MSLHFQFCFLVEDKTQTFQCAGDVEDLSNNTIQLTVLVGWITEQIVDSV